MTLQNLTDLDSIPGLSTCGSRVEKMTLIWVFSECFGFRLSASLHQRYTIISTDTVQSQQLTASLNKTHVPLFNYNVVNANITPLDKASTNF